MVTIVLTFFSQDIYGSDEEDDEESDEDSADTTGKEQRRRRVTAARPGTKLGKALIILSFRTPAYLVAKGDSGWQVRFASKPQ